MADEVILRVQDLQTHFFTRTGVVKAVDGISFELKRGETLGIVGESGSGKSMTAWSILGMVPHPGRIVGGSINYLGENLLEKSRGEHFSGAERRNFKASVQAVFQDPWSSLNPRMRVDQIIAEPLITHQRLSRSAVRAQVQELLQVVGLHPFHAERYPHEFSGGQRQRIAIARALSTRPKLIVLDEPVSALDVSIRAQILNLLKELQSTYELSYLLIAHNLATVRYMSHTVGVMYLGKIVEEAPPIELFTNAQHPYTRALISASLPAHPRRQREEIVLAGEVPSPINPPAGCTFHPRCPFVMERCSADVPALVEYTPRHFTACHLYADGGKNTC
ncbi:Oligopeptide transport ATP-binding protein AppF [Geodia barretti]|uniref:Oligopeptide transport ATP-binding protein AppF n=1 Tax=Geodia barretti TaxID=519541 RepID=A0AA35SZQ2_GEOBA|nr:Oligopeptide transport ATP-binding protein AppF [Geodia barretti]